MTAFLTRFQLDADEERGDGYLYASGRGRAGHAPKNILQPQQFGFASRPPAGSVGMQLAMGGDHSTSLLLGLEHPGFRPKLPAGGGAIYDQWGGILKFVTEGAVMDVQSRTVTFSAGGWTVNGPATFNGNVTINGTLNVSGNITSGGSITDADGDGGA